MHTRILVPFLTSFVIWAAPAHAEEDIVDHFFKGAAEEAGSRAMGAIIDYILSDRPQVSSNWKAGIPHPRYSNVVSDTQQNRWRPSPGFVWADPTDPNDWTVISANASRSSYSAPLLAGGHQGATRYAVVYGGEDGVSVRSSPGGEDVIATAYKARGASFLVLSTSPYYTNGIGWMKVRMVGWMAKRNLRNGDTNVATLDNGLGYVRWDGNGNPKDNFVALRSLGSTSQRLAKVYHNTSLRLGKSQFDTEYEWVEAELVGWMALKGPKGSILIAPLQDAND
jgi:hypothetical protein